MSRLFTSGGQSVGASASVLPRNIQGWFSLGLTGLISLLSKGFSRVFSAPLKASVLWCSAFFIVQLSHPYMTTRKTIPLIIWTFVGKVISLLFNTLPSFLIAILLKSKCLLILWLQSESTWILEPIKNEIWHCFHIFPIYLSWSDRNGCHDICFLNVEF